MLYAPDLAERLDEFDCSNFPVVNKERLRDRHPVHKRSYLDFKAMSLPPPTWLAAGEEWSDNGELEVEARSSSTSARRTVPRDLRPEAERLCGEEHPEEGGTDLVPREIIEREKFGFVAPGSPSLLQRDIPWIQDQLSYERIKRQGYFNPDTVELLKTKYSRPGFTLSQNIEDDLLIVVLTFGLLQDAFKLPALS